jgi:ABC-type lipoprotein export system ATPase subunit
MDQQDPIRRQKILSILDQELQDGENLAAEARKLIGYLLREKKGFQPEDVQKNVVFEVQLGQETVYSAVDFLVSLDGRKAMVIKCSSGSLSSRERQAVAAARVISSPPVLIAVVADLENAEVLDVATGKVTGEGFGAIPIKEQLLRVLSETESKPLSPERIEKEKRILLAFDAIKCCMPQGADGGVKLDDVCKDK